MRCVIGYEPSDEPATLLDLVKGVGFVILIFMPGILGVYFYPNTWISILGTMITLVFFMLIILWIIGGVKR
ncbi:hypothetical protein KAW18_01560 [candidate division WOR-3 bacterium]|nr:hypothetical protein [candidate division WOR-3 bacterium]